MTLLLEPCREYVMGWMTEYGQPEAKLRAGLKMGLTNNGEMYLRYDSAEVRLMPGAVKEARQAMDRGDFSVFARRLELAAKTLARRVAKLDRAAAQLHKRVAGVVAAANARWRCA